MEKWEKWHPPGCEDLETTVATLRRIEAKEAILSIDIDVASRTVRLQVERTLAYRVHLEECVPDVWAKLYDASPARGTFWEILNSDWTRAREAKGGLALYPKARHFAVVTEQNLIEVLTEVEPTVVGES